MEEVRELAAAGATCFQVDEPLLGRFPADVLSLRFGLALSTRLTADTLIQCNSLDDEMSANLRVNFIHAPGSDLFVVFNETRGSDTSVWDFSERGAVVKLTWLKRL